LTGSKDQPISIDEHDKMDGIFFYKKTDDDDNVIEDVRNLTLDNIKAFLRNIPVKKSETSINSGSDNGKGEQSSSNSEDLMDSWGSSSNGNPGNGNSDINVQGDANVPTNNSSGN
jgi:hypothetical protein